MPNLSDPLRLASGTILPNRIVKAAMEENLAARGQVPGGALLKLYTAWGAGGAGLIITGHVMVDARALAQPADVVLDSNSNLDAFRAWSSAARAEGARVMMQINHPGRVIQKDLAAVTWSASDVPIDFGAMSKMFATPRPMTETDIADTIQRFATTAALAEKAGFDGVEIHAAHGYLISQFLSPLTNARNDQWGGSLENRARFLIEVVKAVRARVAPGFAVAVKLNSADFQRGGFDVEDAEDVIRMLGRHSVDFVELSGGSIESMATSGDTADGRTLAREAYFLSFVRGLMAQATMPIMLTGGIRRRSVAQEVLDGGADLVGVATAFGVSTDAATDWLAGGEGSVAYPVVHIRNKALASAARQAVIHQHFRCPEARGRRSMTPTIALAFDLFRRAQARRRYRAWLSTSPLQKTRHLPLPFTQTVDELHKTMFIGFTGEDGLPPD